MNLEKNISTLFQEQSGPDPDGMLETFHETQMNRIKNKQRFMNGLVAMLIIVGVGITSFYQINTGTITAEYYANSSVETEDYLTDDVIDEFAIYFMDESSDVWETIEFLNNIGALPINDMINGGS